MTVINTILKLSLTQIDSLTKLYRYASVTYYVVGLNIGFPIPDSFFKFFDKNWDTRLAAKMCIELSKTFSAIENVFSDVRGEMGDPHLHPSTPEWSTLLHPSTAGWWVIHPKWRGGPPSG